jgi:hypothetical protein
MRVSVLWLFLAFVIIPRIINAQKWPFELWHDGKIVLESNDTLRGLVKYDIQQDIVQFTLDDKTIETFAPRKTLFFEIFDTSVHKYRQFFSLPFAATHGYEAPMFFELLEEGKLTLLSREALELRTYNSPYYMGSYTRQVLINKFYFMNEKGLISLFMGNKKDLLQLMGNKADAVTDYIKMNRLDYENKYDLAKIVEYYNSLSANR